MYERLYEIFITRKSLSFYPTRRHKWLYNVEISLIAKPIVDFATALKVNTRNASVSNIIVSTDNGNLNEKECQVNAHLTEMFKERKSNLINHSKKIKPNHLNHGKLHLNQKGDRRYSVMPFWKQYLTLSIDIVLMKIQDWVMKGKSLGRIRRGLMLKLFRSQCAEKMQMTFCSYKYKLT